MKSMDIILLFLCQCIRGSYTCVGYEDFTKGPTKMEGHRNQ